MWEHVALHQTWFGGSGDFCQWIGISPETHRWFQRDQRDQRRRRAVTQFWRCCDRFRGWAVEGIQMLPVVPASWWHIESLSVETQPFRAFKASGSFATKIKTARCPGSGGFLEEGVGAESLLGVQGLTASGPCPAEFSRDVGR